MSTMLQLQVHALHCEARDVRVVELRDPRGAPLPAFTAGAHLELQLPNGLVRHYSLCNDPAERRRYCIGVGLACNSRGGSRYLHQHLHLGTRVQSSAPRNHFELAPDAGETVFIAGGIGITPIMAMIHHSRAQGRRWRLFYCARSRQRCAFYEDLRALAPEHCTFHFDDEAGGCFDPAAALAGVPMHAHVHTCGPAPLMDAVAAAARGRAPEPCTSNGSAPRLRRRRTTRRSPWCCASRAGAWRCRRIAASSTCSKPTTCACRIRAARACAPPAARRCSPARWTTATACSAPPNAPLTARC